MSIRYHTGTATLIQFIGLSLLSIINSIIAGIETCREQGSECVNNTVATFVLFVIIVLIFGFIWVLGYAAQERRSHRLAYLLILIEAGVVFIAVFTVKHPTDVLELITGLAAVGLGLWVMLLAFRLSRAKGGRIISSQRRRRRITTDKL